MVVWRVKWKNTGADPPHAPPYLFDEAAPAVTAANAAVKGGFVLQADAAQAIDGANRSIVGLGLDCGPLCADVRQFPGNPSSTLLSKQTSFLPAGQAGTVTSLVLEKAR